MASFNYCKIRGKIIEKYGSIENFSKEFGQTATTVGKKLSGKSVWTQSDIMKAQMLLDIPIDKITEYFFYENC